MARFDHPLTKDNAEVVSHGFFWLVIAMLAIGFVTFLVMWSKPVWLGFERKAFVNSHQYIETQRQSITSDLAACKLLADGAQKNALRARIAEKRALIPADAQPYGDC